MKHKSRLFIALSTAIACSAGVQAAEKINLSHFPNKVSPSKGQQQKTSAFLQQKLGLSNRYSFVQKSSSRDAKGNSHTRYQQYYKGIPVWAQQVITHANANESELVLTGHVQSLIEKDLGDNINPAISKSDIISDSKDKLAKKIGKLDVISREKAELVIFIDDKFGKAHLAWHTELLATSQSGKISRQMFIFDASSGLLLKSWDALTHADITGPGGNEKTGKYLYGTDFPALAGSADDAGTTCFLDNENVRAVSLNGSIDTSINTAFSFPCSENTFQEINGAYSPINDAFYFGNVTFDMYDDWYQTSPLPFQLSMKVHYSTNYENAFWDGQAMTFGDGATTFYPLVDINVSVHEVSHGFTEFNANLIYSGESGGMNEAFSDIAGEAGEFYSRGEVDWFVGKDIMKNGDGLRFFEDPTLDGRSIGHYDDYYDGIDVHFSSGIFNRAYYLLSNTEGWDPHKAFDVFVLANQSYWMPDSSFADGACGVISAANDLGYDWADVYAAMIQVGVQCSGNAIDEDNDGMSDIGEMVIGFDATNPEDGDADFDGDGISNRTELNAGFDPKDRDTDNDGLGDHDEYLIHGTSVNNADTDDDGMGDGWEISYGLNPLNDADADADADADGYSNKTEYQDGTDPTDADSYKPAELEYKETYDFEDQALIPGSAPYPGSKSFVISDLYAASGTYSLTNEDIADNEWASVEMIVGTDDGSLTFDLKTSTEDGWDFFVLYIDYESVYAASGENDWQQVSIPISAGTHSIIFSYQKDFVVSGGEDTVWIDNISYSGLAFDTDSDGMLNPWESYYGLNKEDAADAALDNDQDGLTNLEEFNAGTSPIAADTDGDGIDDKTEIDGGTTSAIKADTDGDQINDGLETELGLDPTDAADGTADMDEDGIDNSTEAKYGTALDDASSLPDMLQLHRIDFSQALSDNWDNSFGDTWYTETDSDGVMKLMAEPVSGGKNARVNFTQVFDNGTLTLGVETDSEENADMLEIWIDGTKHSSYSGLTNEEVAIELTRGEHTVSLVYNKDFVRSSAKDRVAINKFEFIAPDADSDNDGVSNGDELALGTQLDNPDSDDDGLTDGEEVELGTNPLAKDTDGDGVSDKNDQYPLDSSRYMDDNGSGSLPLFGILSLLLFAIRRRFSH